MQINIQGYETLNQKLKAVREAVTVAGSRSVRKVSITAKAEWARAIANDINLPIGTIKQAIRIHHTARTSVKIEVNSSNVASLGIGRRVHAIPVIKFKPRQTRQVLTVTIKKSKGKTLIRSGFIQTLKTQGIELITPVRKNMKAEPLNAFDKKMLQKRSLIETVIAQLKNISPIEHTRHRSLLGFMVNVIAGLIVYTWQVNKPSLKLRLSSENNDCLVSNVFTTPF